MTSDERNQLEWLATHLGPGDSRSAAIRAALAQVDALTQQVADLEARAVPQRWVDDVEIHRGSDLGDEETIVAGPSGATWRKMSGYASADGFPRRFPTLSAALSAAKEAP